MTNSLADEYPEAVPSIAKAADKYGEGCELKNDYAELYPLS